MFAEGMNDIAHLQILMMHSLQEQGDLVILTVKAITISVPYGTPSVIIDKGKWYLLMKGMMRLYACHIR